MLVTDPTGDSIDFSHKPEYAKRQPEWTKNATGEALCGPCLDDEQPLSSPTNQKLCMSGGLCEQGNCHSYSAPVSASCTAALAARCGGLGLRLTAFADCAYSAAHLPARTLRRSGCFSADLYFHCIPKNYTSKTLHRL